jgi:malonyl-CoA O-methyltransferase
MLKKAQAKPHAGKVDFVCHDVSKRLPVKDSAFDKVLSSLVLEHIENLRPFFRELKRICRKKGSIVISTMHPAMMLRGTAARFTDPKTGRKVYPGSFDHKVSDIVMSAMREGLTIEHLGEHSPDARLARRYPKAKKYIGWPMLLSMVLRP